MPTLVCSEESHKCVLFAFCVEFCSIMLCSVVLFCVSVCVCVFFCCVCLFVCTVFKHVDVFGTSIFAKHVQLDHSQLVSCTWFDYI